MIFNVNALSAEKLTQSENEIGFYGSKCMFEYDELACKAAAILDQCDFKEDIEHCKRTRLLDAYDIREFLEKNYLWDVRDAFDNLSLDEFMEYLTARYNVRWHEISHYEMS